MAIYDYIRASSMSDEERAAGLRSGELTPWRTSQDGEAWFKRPRLPMILGVPRDTRDAIEAEADEMEQVASDVYEETPNVIRDILSDPDNEGMREAVEQYLDEYFEDDDSVND